MLNFKKIIKKIPSPLSIIISTVVFLVLCLLKKNIGGKGRISESILGSSCVVIFTQEFCPHCHELKKFCENMYISKYNVEFRDIADRGNFNLFLKQIRLHRVPASQVGTPAIFSDRGYMIGFDRNNGDDIKFREFLNSSELDRTIEKTKNKEVAEKLSLKFMLLTVAKEVFSLNNIYVFIFLYIILLLCAFNKSLIIVSCYFGFSTIIDFLLLTGHMNLLPLDGTMTVLRLFIGYLCLLFATDKFIENGHSKAFAADRVEGSIPNSTLFAISLLTMLSSSIKFLKPSGDWQKYELVLNRYSSKFFLYYFCAIFSTFFYSILNISFVFVILVLHKKYKNYYINYLTIVNLLLLLIAGIFIMFV
ncbi:MAG: hypothetical protein LBB13_02075 [Rickettsiales bacterium]|jgi:glutaredoxin|nr:hypothetical protein [Rickettsiales bacterium]